MGGPLRAERRGGRRVRQRRRRQTGRRVIPIVAGLPAWQLGEDAALGVVPAALVADPRFQVRAVLMGFSGDVAIRMEVEEARDVFRADNPDFASSY